MVHSTDKINDWWWYIFIHTLQHGFSNIYLHSNVDRWKNILCGCWWPKPHTTINSIGISRVSFFPQAIKGLHLVEAGKFIFYFTIIVTLQQWLHQSNLIFKNNIQQIFQKKFLIHLTMQYVFSVPVCISAKLQELATDPMHHTLGNSFGSHQQYNILKKRGLMYNINWKGLVNRIIK